MWSYVYLGSISVLALAQDVRPRPGQDPILSMTFNSPNLTNPWDTSTSTDQSFSIAIERIPEAFSCYDFASLPRLDGVFSLNGNTVRLNNTNGYSASYPYSTTYYRQGYSPEFTNSSLDGASIDDLREDLRENVDWTEVADISVVMYTAPNCEERGEDDEELTTYTWNCGQGTPYVNRGENGIQSLSIAPPTSEEREEDCVTHETSPASKLSVSGVVPFAALGISAILLDF